MRRIDEEATVVMLACLTEDRSPEEQRALLAVALRVDKERAKRTVTNDRPIEPCCVAEARMSYVSLDGKPVDLTAAQARSFSQMCDRYYNDELGGNP